MKGFLNAKTYIEGFGIRRVNVGVENGRIVYIGNEDNGIQPIYDVGEGYVLPGFIDLHVHGAAGQDVMDGSVKSLKCMATALASEGVTGFLATTMTQSSSNIFKALRCVGEYIKSNPKSGAEVLGVHLEGPFIAQKYAGAQPKEYILPPSIDLFEKFNKASGYNIKKVTTAPELDGAEDFIKHLVKKGIVVSAGHSNATYAIMENAVNWGVNSVTHTYNAQSGLHHRDVGLVGAAMLLDGLNCEIICDLAHVSPPAIKLLIKNKRSDSITVITDGIRAKHTSDGVSELGGQTVYVKNGQARLTNGALAGSVLKMNMAIKNLVQMGVPLTTAVDFAAINPARQLGIDSETGGIKARKRGDFAILDENFNVLLTLRNGNIIYKR